MGEVEIKIGGFVEQKRLNTMQHINSDIAEVVQDNNGLEYLQKLYEKLHLTERDRDIIDSIFFLYKIPQRQSRKTGILCWYVGRDRFFETVGPVLRSFSTFKRQLLGE